MNTVTTLNHDPTLTEDLIHLPLRRGRGQAMITVSPDLAQHWLRFNRHNRDLDPCALRRYVREIEHGEWQDNGETIKFAGGGHLIDGATRLHAIVEANLAVLLLVVWGLSSDVQSTVDDGRRRTPSNAAQMLGLDRWAARVFGGAIQAIMNYERSNTLSDSASVRYSNREAEQFLLTHKTRFAELLDVLRPLESRHKPMKTSRALVYAWLFAKPTLRDSDEVEAFFRQFFTGVELTHGSPVRYLRDRFLYDLKLGVHPGHDAECRMLVNAWNAWRCNRVWVDAHPLSRKTHGRPEVL